MNLTGFELDLPYIVNLERLRVISKQYNCTLEEAKKLDYNNNWKKKRRAFNIQTRCISSMFERLLVKYKTKDCSKVIVECVEEITDERIINYIGTYKVQILFDYKKFSSSNIEQKKTMSLEMLMQGIKLIADFAHWDVDSFTDVYQKIKDLNYENEWVFKKPLRSPNNQLIGKVICYHDVEKFDVYIVVSDKRNNILKREKVLSEIPHEFAYAEKLGSIVWLSSIEIALKAKKGNDIYFVKI